MQNRLIFISRLTEIPFEERAFSHDRAAVRLPKDEIDCLHYHNCIEFGVCENGEGLFVIGNSFETVKVGDVVFIPPRAEHYSKSLYENHPCHFRFLYFDPTHLESDLLNVDMLMKRLENARPAVMRGEAAKTLAVRRLITSFFCDRTMPDELFALMAAEMLLFHTEQRNENKQEHDGAMLEAAAYIKLYYAQDLRICDLARLFHLSESRFRVRFRQEYGMTPHEYLAHVRADIGAELLMRTNLTVAEISSRVGFSCASEFYRCFSRIHGTSPSIFRENTRGDLLNDFYS